MKDIHRLTPEEALARLGSTASGLPAAEAAARLAQVTSGRLVHHAAIAVARKGQWMDSAAFNAGCFGPYGRGLQAGWSQKVSIRVYRLHWSLEPRCLQKS